jgi:hypothetical protein
MATSGRQQPTRRREQRAASRVQLRALDLTTQNVQLMAQQEQVDVVDVDASAAEKQQLQQRHDEQMTNDTIARSCQGQLRRRRSKADQRVGTLHAVGGADWTEPEWAKATVIARMKDYEPSDEFLMELSIEPVA